MPFSCRASSLLGLAILLSAGCPGCPPGGIVNPDGGQRGDAGETKDGGDASDGGAEGNDAGRTDAGSRFDGGEEDAGPADAGLRDGGLGDGGLDDGGLHDGGPRDAGLNDGGLDDGGLDAGPFDAGPPGLVCTNDADCAPQVCRLLVTSSESDLEGRCSSPAPSTRTRGDGCSQDADCQTGLCLNQLCSGVCDGPSACGLNQVCGSRVVSVDDVSVPADVCLRAILDPVACETNRDCAATGRICRDLEPVDGGGSALFCANPTPGDGDIGAACSGNFLEEITFCRTGLCDDADEGEGACTAGCTSDADCSAGGAGWTCTGSGVGGFDGRLCGEACVRQSDCAEGRSCSRRQDTVDNRNEFVCDGHRGQSVAGELVATGSDCQTGLARIDGTTSERYCTEVCVEDDDCPGAMTCSAITTTFPDGTGVQELLLCAR